MNKKQGSAVSKLNSSRRPEYPLPQGRDYFKVRTIKPTKPAAEAESPAADFGVPRDAQRPRSGSPHLQALPRKDAPVHRAPAPESGRRSAAAQTQPVREMTAATPQGESAPHKGQPVFTPAGGKAGRHAQKSTDMLRRAPVPEPGRKPAVGINQPAAGGAKPADATRRRPTSRMALKASNADIFAVSPDTEVQPPAMPLSRMANKAAAIQAQDTVDVPVTDTRSAANPAPVARQARLRAVPAIDEAAETVPQTATRKPAVQSAEARKTASLRQTPKDSAEKTTASRTRRPVRLPLNDDELDALGDDDLFLDTPPSKSDRRSARPMPETERSRRASGAQAYPAVRPPRAQALRKRRIIILAGLALIATVAALFLLLNNNDAKIPTGAVGPMATVYAAAEPSGTLPEELPLTGSAVVPTPTPTQTPLATATVSPTATPEASPTATATPAVTPKPTATPKATAKPTATPKPTVKPTATPKPTVKPTVTPKPTVKPTATPKPTATATPRPTATATPKPTATPTATPAPTPEPTTEG